MAQAIVPYRDKLPVVSEEIGDTWIYGVGSDPLKVARFREVARLGRSGLRGEASGLGDATDVALLRRLLLEAEHTWGTDTKTWLDFDNYKPADLAPDAGDEELQGGAVQLAGEAAGSAGCGGGSAAAVAGEAETAIEGLKPKQPVIRTGAQSAGKPIETAHFVLQIDAKTGAIDGCAARRRARVGRRSQPDRAGGVSDAFEGGLRHFIKSYLTTTEDWAFEGFWQAEYRAVRRGEPDVAAGSGECARGGDRGRASDCGAAAVQG